MIYIYIYIRYHNNLSQPVQCLTFNFQEDACRLLVKSTGGGEGTVGKAALERGGGRGARGCG